MVNRKCTSPDFSIGMHLQGRTYRGVYFGGAKASTQGERHCWRAEPTKQPTRNDSDLWMDQHPSRGPSRI